MGDGPVALVGSGEFLDGMTDIDTRLLAGRPSRAVIIATASVPDGQATFRHWMELGTRHFGAMGIEPVACPVVDRRSADDPTLAALVAGAGLVYLSGGNPRFLAATLRGTAVWSAVVAAWRSGTALAGCSAGAMALTAEAPDPWARSGGAGLGLVGHLVVIPHFDRVAGFWPTMVDEALDRLAPRSYLVGIDEDTALVGGPEDWRVEGRQRVWTIDSRGRRPHTPGTRLTLTPPVVAPER